MFHEFLFWGVQENILYLKVMWYSSQYLIKFPICWTFKITDPSSFLLYKRNSALLKSIHYGWDYFYFKGNPSLIMTQKRKLYPVMFRVSCCLDRGDFWRCLASGKQYSHSLSGRTGALSGGWNDADFFNMGKRCLIPVKLCVCVWKKNQWYFSKDYEIWIACSVWITLPLFVVVLLWTVIYVSQCKMQSLVSLLKRNCSVKWGINFILGVINRAQKKAYCEETSCCRHADS